MSNVDPLMKAAGGGISGDDRPNAPKSGAQGLFTRVLVFDMLCNLYDREEYQNLVSLEDKPNYNPPLNFSVQEIIDAPRNAILGYDISEKSQIKLSSTKPENNTPLNLYYPFFSSHVSLPVKAGEHIWAVTPGAGTDRSYWITRISEADHVEDTNYTHADRRFLNPGPVLPFENQSDKLIVPSFPNGPSFLGLFSSEPLEVEVQQREKTKYQIDDRFGYENIVNSDPEKFSFAFEPVPRYTKRPGDLVFQGSHNTTIVLGSDRGDSTRDRPDPNVSNSKPEIPLIPGQGAIDIVAGRGRYFMTKIEAKNLEKSFPENTNALSRPRLSFNTRGNLETLKDPSADENYEYADNRYVDIPEGDPDFINDAARVYVSMTGEIDSKLGITPDIIPAVVEGILDERDLDSSVSLKADIVRIVARKTPVSGLSNFEHSDSDQINGDIRLIKQGEPGVDACQIYLLSDGSVHIGGRKIFIGNVEGRTSSDYGGPGPGLGGSQPYVRFSDLKKSLEQTYEAITVFCDTILTHVTPGQGAPSPQINQAATELQQALEKIKSDTSNFDKLASERIFGE